MIVTRAPQTLNICLYRLVQLETLRWYVWCCTESYRYVYVQGTRVKGLKRSVAFGNKKKEKRENKDEKKEGEKREKNEEEKGRSWGE